MGIRNLGSSFARHSHPISTDGQNREWGIKFRPQVELESMVGIQTAIGSYNISIAYGKEMTGADSYTVSNKSVYQDRKDKYYWAQRTLLQSEKDDIYAKRHEQWQDDQERIDPLYRSFHSPEPTRTVITNDDINSPIKLNSPAQYDTITATLSVNLPQGFVFGLGGQVKWKNAEPVSVSNLTIAVAKAF